MLRSRNNRICRKKCIIGNLEFTPQNHALQHKLECKAAHCLSNHGDHPDLWECVF